MALAVTVRLCQWRRQHVTSRWVAVENLDPIEWLAFYEYTDAVPASEEKAIYDWLDREPDPFGYLWGHTTATIPVPVEVRRLRETVFRPPVKAA